jgi:hypothetical protein
MAPEAIQAQLLQGSLQRSLPALVSGRCLAASNFSQHVGVPAGEAGNIFRFMHEMIGPQSFRFTEKRMVEEGSQDMLA